MPRYFFDSRDGEAFSRDEDGLEFDGLHAAGHAAQEALADLARDAIPKDGGRELAVEVRDETESSRV